MNFYELEKRCKRRRVRVIIFKILIIVFFIFSLIITIWSVKKILFSDSSSEKSGKNTKFVKKETKKETLFQIIDDSFFHQHSNEKMSDDVFIKPDIPSLNSNVKNKTFIKSKKIISSRKISFKECIQKANFYYNKKEYLKALEWAKNANLIDKDNPKSWIVTAKTLIAMGKKDEALSILKIYYSYHKDKKVKKLIGELE